MKKINDKSSLKEGETLNVISETNKTGDDMQTQACLKISDETKIDDYTSKLVVERRSVNSDRRINNSYDYRGPARRMNIDRRK